MQSTSCTSKENVWIFPTPKRKILSLQLSKIDFRAPKRQKVISTPSKSASTCTFASPSKSEMEGFYSEIAKEQEKKPVILSVIKPYNEEFVHSCHQLPPMLQGLFKPAYLQKDYAELLTLAESHLHEKATPAMVEHLHQQTIQQRKSKQWFRYRAGRITASRFRQVLHTNPQQPSTCTYIIITEHLLP